MRLAIIVLGTVLFVTEPVYAEQSPKDVAVTFYNHLIRGKFIEAYTLLHPNDQKAQAFDEWRSRAEVSRPILASQWKIRVVAVDEKSAQGTVTISIESPEIEKLLNDVQQKCNVLSKLICPPLPNLGQLIEKYSTKSLPMQTSQFSVKLRKDKNGTWRIFTAAQSRKLISDYYKVNSSDQDERLKIATQLAKILGPKSEWIDTARKLADSVRKLRVNIAYRKKIKLDNVRKAEGKNFGQLVEGIFGTVVNTGTKTARMVKIRVYFLDAKGQAMFEKEYHPVLVSSFSSSSNGPLRPNYRRNFGFKADDVPDGWSGKFSAEVIQVELQE